MGGDLFPFFFFFLSDEQAGDVYKCKEMITMEALHVEDGTIHKKLHTRNERPTP